MRNDPYLNHLEYLACTRLSKGYEVSYPGVGQLEPLPAKIQSAGRSAGTTSSEGYGVTGLTENPM